MNTRVNFGLAKLLKEKGFKLLERPIFYKGDKSMQQGSYMYDNGGELALVSMPTIALDKGFIDCPTIADVVMWLYEKHGVWIYVSKPDENGWVIHWQGLESYPTLIYFNSPTEAYSEAIKYTLEKLIK